jgi:hypothetical protein
MMLSFDRSVEGPLGVFVFTLSEDPARFLAPWPETGMAAGHM